MTKKTDNPSYELVFIATDEKVATLKKMVQLIEQNGGTVFEKESWGSKRFAYPIKKRAEGYYFVWSLKLPKDKVTAFEKSLHFQDPILRYLLKKV